MTTKASPTTTDKCSLSALAIASGYFFFLLAILLVFGYTPTNDGDGYIELALICLEEGQPYPCTRIIETSSFIWNIGAINLVDASLWLFGSVKPLLVLMCLLKALTALLTQKIARKLFSARVSIAAMLIFVAYPNNWGDATTILSEIPAVFLALSATYLLLSEGRFQLFLTAGILLCLSNWFRSVAPIFIVSFAVYFIIFRREQLKKRLLPMLLGYALCATALGTETYLRTGHFVYKGDTLWFNVCSDAYDGASVAPHYGEDPYEKGKPRYIENMERYDCFERSDIWRDRCLAWIMENKAEWLKKVPLRMVYMYFNDIDNMAFCLPNKSDAERNYITLPYRNIGRELPNLTAAQYAALLCTAAYYFIMLLSLGGFALLINRREWGKAALPALIIVIGTLSITLVIHGETRFKAPLMPFFIMVSAYMACFVKDKMRQKRCKCSSVH